MNSYSENLSAVVLAYLQNQRLAEKAAYSKLNAAMFTLYYAEGARLSATEKLKAAKADLEIKEAVKNASVAQANKSTNLLASAEQANQFYAQTTNNTAACAAHVQVAANAIVKLASDVGSIFSIINAADNHSDIFEDAGTIREYIDHTAHLAEEASKLAMEVSMYTSQVSVPTVLDKSASTTTEIHNLLALNLKAFDEASKMVDQDQVILDSATSKEKFAEGTLEDIMTNHNALLESYRSTNCALNLDLSVSKEGNTSYKISFNQISNPFPKEGDIALVQDYHFIVVKDSKKATFSMANAEEIRQNSLDLGEGVVSRQFIEVNLSEDGAFEKSLDFLDYPSLVPIRTLNPVIDSDGDSLQIGFSYVVFVMAVFSDEYKRRINNFSNYLSAPSKEFTLTNTLTPIDVKRIRIDRLSANRTEEDIKMELDFRFSDHTDTKLDFELRDERAADYTHKISFNTLDGGLYNPMHHCIFLPATTDLNNFLLSQSLLEHSIATLEIVNDTPKDKDVKKRREEPKKVVLPFIFNLPIAEQVSPANYTQMKTTKDPKPNLSDRSSEQNWYAFFGPETTDNFGDLLIEGRDYYPVILTRSTYEIDYANMFTNSLSQSSVESMFTFELKKSK